MSLSKDYVFKVIRASRRISREIYRFFMIISNKWYFHYRIKKQILKKYERLKKVLWEDPIDISLKPDLNVVIITIDCLRASNLSLYGHFRKTTPFIDSIKGSKFKAISASNWTYPSVMSILSGLYPHNHGAILSGHIKHLGKNAKSLLKPRGDVVTLPEILFLLGYDVYFLTAISVAYLPFCNYVALYLCDFWNSLEVFKTFLKAIEMNKSRRFFAYIHLGDLHEPLNPPDAFKNILGKVENLPNINTWAFKKPEEQRGERYQKYVYNRVLLYDNTLRYVDYAIQRFYEILESKGLLDSTILIITSDHGEEFWEHAEMEAQYFYDPRGYCGIGHGHNMFNEIIEVPLILSGPRIPNRRINRYVSGVDVFPTVLELLGVTYKLHLDGTNLFRGTDKRELLSESCAYGFEKKALLKGNLKLLYSQGDGVAWAFDLHKDPREMSPIVDENTLSKLLYSLRAALARSIVARKLTKLRRKWAKGGTQILSKGKLHRHQPL